MHPYFSHILSFGKQFKSESVTTANFENLRKDSYDGIVVFGMGGSGNAGRMFGGFTKVLGLPPILVWSDYGVPEAGFKNPLYILVSCSGDTDETVSNFKDILHRYGGFKPFNFAVVTADGKFKKMATENSAPAVFFEKGEFKSRELLGVMYSSIYRILAEIFPLSRKEPDYKLPESFSKLAEELSSSLKDKIAIIYTDEANRNLGYTWKINFNETAKIMAFRGIFPEVFHNEIESFSEGGEKLAVLWIYSKEIPSELSEKVERLEKIMDEKRIFHHRLPLEGADREEEIWNLVMLSHLTAFKIAEAKGLDPSEIPIISKLKEGK